MRRRPCWLSGLMLVLAVGGLLIMHGLDAPGHHVAADDHGHVAPAAHETVRDHAVAATTAPGSTDHHGALGHVMAVCVAVMAVAAGTTALRLRLRRSLAPAVAPVPVARAWVRRALDELRPPVPDRLALCIHRI